MILILYPLTKTFSQNKPLWHMQEDISRYSENQTQPISTCSKLTIEALEQVVEYVQS